MHDITEVSFLVNITRGQIIIGTLEITDSVGETYHCSFRIRSGLQEIAAGKIVLKAIPLDSCHHPSDYIYRWEKTYDQTAAS
ncbi:hypothetical protein ACFL27_14540 [candidate division CSSED10-310 bacterium]|uniref:Uncharacterized protein n=1 Tax=candidate division CSSED10-310 bacterium TaxID=2855610 RepID=A0ABV6YYY0_UNCC1